MEEENKEIKQDVISKAKEEVEKLIKTATENGLQASNVQLLYQLIDIHKDIENEKYWNNKEENNMYMRDDYGNDYRGGRSRDSRGRYMGDRRSESYRGQRVLDEMYDGYRNYSDGREEYGHQEGRGEDRYSRRDDDDRGLARAENRRWRDYVFPQIQKMTFIVPAHGSTI